MVLGIPNTNSRIINVTLSVIIITLIFIDSTESTEEPSSGSSRRIALSSAFILILIILLFVIAILFVLLFVRRKRKQKQESTNQTGKILLDNVNYVGFDTVRAQFVTTRQISVVSLSVSTLTKIHVKV